MLKNGRIFKIDAAAMMWAKVDIFIRFFTHFPEDFRSFHKSIIVKNNIFAQKFAIPFIFTH